MDQRNNIVFLFCFLLALLIWLAISLSSSKSYNIDIPISPNLVSGEVLLSSFPDLLKLTVEGKTSDLLSFENSSRKSKLSLPLPNSKELSVEYIDGILLKHLNDYSLKLVRNHTGTIPIERDSLSSKEVIVHNNSSLSTKSGYVILDQTISPDRVMISGPSSFLIFVDSISTSRTELKNIDKDISDSLHLLKPMSELINIEQEKVLLRINTSKLENQEQSFSTTEMNLVESKYDSIIISFLGPIEQSITISDLTIKYTDSEESQDQLIQIESQNPTLFKIINATFLESN